MPPEHYSSFPFVEALIIGYVIALIRLSGKWHGLGIVAATHDPVTTSAP
jgi:hypothetical protein